MTYYTWDKSRGVIDETDHQVLQLVGGTAKFRNLCGALLVEKLNVKARGDEYAKSKKQPCGHPVSAIVQADEGTAYCSECAKESEK